MLERVSPTPLLELEVWTDEIGQVRAKEDARRPSAYMESRTALSEGTLTSKKSLRPDRDAGTTWRIEQQERYKRNAMISRLGSVADGVWM